LLGRLIEHRTCAAHNFCLLKIASRKLISIAIEYIQYIDMIQLDISASSVLVVSTDSDLLSWIHLRSWRGRVIVMRTYSSFYRLPKLCH
jgi:hypothetical protein